MPFDPSKDKVLHVIGEETLTDTEVLEVTIRSYNGREPKIVAMRKGTNPKNGSTYFNHLGRMDFETAQVAIPLLHKAYDKLDSL